VITIACGVIDGIVAHARDSVPAECCGLLLGGADTVLAAAPARNIADDPARRFLIDPKDHIDGRRHARDRGLQVVGFYHSHPVSPAEPSAADLAEASYPGHLYVIVSLAAATPNVTVYRFDAGNFQPMPFVTVG